MNRLIENNWARINAIFFISMFATFLMSAHAALHTVDVWFTGDWLINYEGGFVRRGLFGEAFLKVSSLAHVELLTLIVATQIALCLWTFVFTFKLARHIKPTAINALLLFSPAFLQFMVLGHDALKKEILLYALMSFHSYYLLRTKGEVRNGYLVLLSLLFVLMVLTHEMLVAFLPYFVCGLYLQGNHLSREKLLKYTLLLVPAALAASTVMFVFRGDAQVVAEICASLQQNAPADCQTGQVMIDGHPNIGAISFLAKDIAYGKMAVVMSNPPKTLATYGVMFILAFMPIFLLFRKIEILKSNRYLLVFPLLSIVATLPLLFVVADYGRLICIHVICLTYVALQMLNMNPEKDAKSGGSSVYVWLLCLAFIFGWRAVSWKVLPNQMFTPLRIYKEMTAVNLLAPGRDERRDAEAMDDAANAPRLTDAPSPIEPG